MAKVTYQGQGHIKVKVKTSFQFYVVHTGAQAGDLHSTEMCSCFISVQGISTIVKLRPLNSSKCRIEVFLVEFYRICIDLICRKLFSQFNLYKY